MPEGKVSSLSQKFFEDLGLQPEKFQEHFAKNHIYLVRTRPSYLRFAEDIAGVEKGTVFFPHYNEYMRGFPKIRRAYMLETALKNNFSSYFYAEEKMDGYNVRTALVNGKLVAVTRGGLTCAYTANRISNLLNLDFFEDNPSLMLCGEVVGLQNPFQEKSYPEAEDFGYFIFDIRDKKTGKGIPIEQKYKLIRHYGLTGVHSFGKFTWKGSSKLLNLVRKLGMTGREGLVLKSNDMNTIFKYTANQSTNNDLKYAFKFPFDYGQSFMFRRLVRQAFQAYELGLSGKDLKQEAAKLGESILIPMVETIKEVASNKEVAEDFDLEVPTREFGNKFIRYLQHLGIRPIIRKVTKSANGYVFSVSRRYPSTNDKTKAYLRGEFSED